MNVPILFERAQEVEARIGVPVRLTVYDEDFNYVLEDSGQGHEIRRKRMGGRHSSEPVAKVPPNVWIKFVNQINKFRV